jgi:hypothetical protein
MPVIARVCAMVCLGLDQRDGDEAEINRRGMKFVASAGQRKNKNVKFRNWVYDAVVEANIKTGLKTESARVGA